MLDYVKDIAGKISLADTDGFDAGGFSGQVYIPNEANAGYSALLVTVKGSHPKKRMVDTTRNYYVIEGKGTFVLDGTPYEATPGDLFIVSPGHEYEYQGDMKLFEFNVSPDNRFKDEVLE